MDSEKASKILEWSVVGLAAIVLVVILAYWSDAQETKIQPPTNMTATVSPAPLTPDEKNLISRAEVTLLKAQQKKKDDAEADDKEISRASQALTQQVQKVYTDRKITADQYTLCEQQAPPYCQAAPNNDLSLQPVPKPKETK